MVEMAIAALAKVGSAIGLSGAGAAAGAAGSGLSALGTISSVVQVLGGIGAGMAAKNQAEAAAMQTELQAGQEHLQSQQRQTAMKRQLLQVLGENDVTFAAAGIDISGGGGIAQSAAADAKKRAAQELTIDRQDADFRRALLRMRARGQRAKGRSALGGALLGAVGTGIGHGIDLRTVGGGLGGSDPWSGMRTVG